MLSSSVVPSVPSPARSTRVRNFFIAAFAAMLMLACIGAASADATTRIVTSGGSNTGDCSATACATIQYAINQSSATGDNIAVGTGTFNGAFTLTKSIRIHGDGANTILTAPSSPVTHINAGADNSEIEDVKFLGLGTIPTSTASAIRTDAVTSGVKLTNIEVTNFSSYAIANHNNAVSTNWVLDGVNAHHNQHGMRVRGAASGLTITNSHFDNNISHGFFVADNGGAFDDVTITNSTFNGNGDKAIYLERGTNLDFSTLEANNTGGGAHGSPHAIEFNLKYGATAGPVSVTDSEVDGSTGGGIVVRGGAVSPIVGSVTLTGNTISNTVVAIGLENQVTLANVDIDDNALADNSVAVGNNVSTGTLDLGSDNTFDNNGSNVAGPGVTDNAPSGDLYVATTGIDAGNLCTVELLPCATIERALEVASVNDGNTIHVAAGEYTSGAALSINKKVKIVGAGKALTTLKPGFSPPGAYGVWISVEDGASLDLSALAVDGDSPTHEVGMA
ncbi:MAG: right-handed parallel beta-helix repeat-containing protein, partial [Solirubrobacterales bacterium]